MNLDRNRISYYEVKATNPTIDSIQPLADFFNVPVEYFFGKKDQQKPRGPSSQLDKRLVQLKKLTRSQQQTVIAMLDGLLFQLSESQT
jgi:transcriptional regulator with XRE-family HTH domain